MTGPALSNYLSVLALEVAGEVVAYRRGSHAAHVAYLAAGVKLVDARGNARRGEWAPFLAACGIEARTARNMMTLARADLTADDLTIAGGVRGALEALREATAAAVETAADALDAGEKPETVSAVASPPAIPNPPVSVPRGAPDPAEKRALAHESALAGSEPRSVHAGALGEPRFRDRTTSLPLFELEAGARRNATPARGLTLYQWRRAMGFCTVCAGPANGRARCSGCAAALNRKRRSQTRIAGELVTRIEAAAAAGEGLTLAPADVIRLAGG